MGISSPARLEIGFDYSFLLPTTNDRVPQVYVENHRVLNLDPADPLWVGHHTPGPEHKTGISHRDELKMDWSHGHNRTIHNGISRIGFYTGGHAARFRDEDLADKWAEKSEEWITLTRITRSSSFSPPTIFMCLACPTSGFRASRAWASRRCNCSVGLERGRDRQNPEGAGT